MHSDMNEASISCSSRGRVHLNQTSMATVRFSTESLHKSLGCESNRRRCVGQDSTAEIRKGGVRAEVGGDERDTETHKRRLRLKRVRVINLGQNEARWTQGAPSGPIRCQ